MYSKLKTVYHTVKHLKLTQIFHQLQYRLVSPKTLKAYGSKYEVAPYHILRFKVSPQVEPCWNGGNKFRFLNKPVYFKEDIKWDFQAHGKLWNYNLQYANYLHQPDISDESKIRLMRSQYEWLLDGRLALEPYPVSLRAINTMRWISADGIADAELLKSLYAELDFLSTRLEYHLLGNHLLENAFALMMGGAFFSNDAWLRTGQKIVEKELAEQILSDGAHFELSPMYHQIIFFRILELLDWYSAWPRRDNNFEALVRRKAADMRDWLKNITFRNGDIPHFNDSASGIAYSSSWLFRYADLLGVKGDGKSLKESGYRSVTGESYELRIDFAQIGPSYQPGHAHADALSFILYYKGTPLLVEHGTSTYQIGPRRSLERSTEAHNTVVVEGRNQSEVWGGFRVARRAKTTILRDGNDGVYEGKHDGYRRLGIEHARTFETKADYIKIGDRLSSARKAESFWHLHPDIGVTTFNDEAITLTNGVRIAFEGASNLGIEDYQYAEQYNTYLPAKRLVVSFSSVLTTTITFGKTE